MSKALNYNRVTKIGSRIGVMQLSADWHRDHGRRAPDLPFLRELARRHGLRIEHVMAVAASVRPRGRAP